MLVPLLGVGWAAALYPNYRVNLASTWSDSRGGSSSPPLSRELRGLARATTTAEAATSRIEREVPSVLGKQQWSVNARQRTGRSTTT